MRAAFWLLALFALAVALTLAARVDEGYVIVVYPPWRMELSFMLALVLLIGLMAIAYAVVRLGQTALRLPDDVRDWHARRRGGAADRALMDAIRAHLDGDAFRAGKLARKAQASQAPDIAERLIAAGATALPPEGRLKTWLKRLPLKSS
jgi:HemY protein